MLTCYFLLNSSYTFFGEENDNPCPYSCLGNPMDKETWWAIVHWVTRVRHDLTTKQHKFLFYFRNSVHFLSHIWLFSTSWTAACQASLSITNSLSLLKLISIKLVTPSNHLILCHPLLLLTSIFPSIRVFSNESALHIRWPKYWSFSFSISPFNE